MGSLVSRILGAFNWGPKQVRILILGLDNAGKTTILYHLKSPSQELTSTIPTIGFNVETLHYKQIKFQVWDLGGQTSIRPCVVLPVDGAAVHAFRGSVQSEHGWVPASRFPGA